MQNLAKYSSLLEKAIEDLKFPENPQKLYDPLRYFMKIGGKRIRPVLTILAGELYGLTIDEVLPAALSIEIFHNFSLIHDDIMDEAPLRRGNETVHTKWNNNIAILSGDVLLVKAYQELTKQKAEHLKPLLELFNKTAVEVCEGQQMDMDFETENYVSIDSYLEMIRLKTSVLLGCALQMGAVIGNASSDEQNSIYQFGQNIGIAFQIQDDILDFYADHAKFGKQVGGDVVAGKKTILYLKALELADDEDKLKFKEIYANQNIQDRISEVRNFNEKYDVREACEELKNKYYDSALESLKNIKNASDEKLEVLSSLASYLVEREH